MRRDSVIIMVLSTLVAIAIVGIGYYLQSLSAAATSPISEEAGWTTLETRADPAVGNSTNDSAQAPSGRTDTPIKCHDPEVGDFWTNADRCEDADLHNRLSYAAPLATTTYQERYGGQGYLPPASAAAKGAADQKPQPPNLRLYAKAPPDGLNVSCKFSVGKALETERDLAAADNPRESVWREDYCKWRCEAIQQRCPVADSFFYYRYQTLCGPGLLNTC
jgi:hypothetical protein